MTEIDFYTHVEDRLKVACQLVQKARGQALKVLVYLSADTLPAMDERLWTFQAESFIPHCRLTDPLAKDTPVLLADTLEKDLPPMEVMINLSQTTPPQFARFDRLIEIVSQSDEDKVGARERFKHYRDRGYVLRTHDLSHRSS